jgi:hypothetical protein
MKLKVIILLLFLFSSGLNAQVSNYQDGYIILNSGDTIFGKLNLDKELLLSTRVKYRDNANSKVAEYLPSQASEFGFTGSNNVFKKITHKYLDKESKETVIVFRFSRVLVTGQLELYKLEQFSEEYNKQLSTIPSYAFYIKKGVDFYKLEKTEKTFNAMEFKVFDRYKGALKYLLGDNKKIIPKIDKLQFKEKDLKSIIYEYNSTSSAGSPVKMFGDERKNKNRHF